MWFWEVKSAAKLRKLTREDEVENGEGGHLWETPTRPLGVRSQDLRLKPASGATLGAVGAAGKYLHGRLLVCLPQGAGSSFLQGMLEGDFKKSELKAHEGDMH